MGDMADFYLDQMMDLDEEYLKDPYRLDDEGNPPHNPFRRSASKPSGPGKCPICGSKTIEKEGKFGKFYGCTKFPACKGSRDY